MKKPKARRFPKSGKKNIKIGNLGILKVKWNSATVDIGYTAVEVEWRPNDSVRIMTTLKTNGNIADAVNRGINEIFDDRTNNLPDPVRTGRPFVFGELTRSLK